jgi:hypothetical protein
VEQIGDVASDGTVIGTLKLEKQVRVLSTHDGDRGFGEIQ